MRSNPHLYEVHARVFLERLSAKYGRRLTLASVPDGEWRALAGLGFDLVWLMGVWQRSPRGRRLALANRPLRREFQRALPDWRPRDVGGSAYAIYSYELDPALGRPEELAEVRARLNRCGLRLMLDFVPNHLAMDHPWTVSYPDRFIRGDRAAVSAHPDWFYSPAPHLRLAHGRDPNFGPWNDTVQVNFYSREMRQAMTEELLKIAGVADGVRCDMAMLALNRVFGRVWGDLVKGLPAPRVEFWAQGIRRVRERRRDFVFLAEVYWGMEGELQSLGFDFTYDKVLYDRLRYSPAPGVRAHLTADARYQRRLARFVENHDETRAADAFGRERSLAAATVIGTLPGLRLLHDGQFEGRRVKTPVHLVREPEEPVDHDLAAYYERLLAIVNDAAFHEGEWTLLDAGPAWPGNESHRNLLAWLWRRERQLKVVVVNYAPTPSQGRLRLPLPCDAMTEVVFREELTGETYVRDPQELSTLGLYVARDEWGAHILDLVQESPDVLGPPHQG